MTHNRRIFLGTVGTALFTTRGLFVSDSITPAVGQITLLSGRVLDASGSPVNNAVVEIWQTDNNGVYINSRAPNKERQDQNFQGFGRFTTASNGQYNFRTIKPVPYEGRCPHIHVRVNLGRRELLTTQIFVNGHAMNARDGVLNELRDPIDRELVLADFAPIANSKIAELAVKFEIVLGRTPQIGHHA
jgi:protocatechuate 3,4-dioxygenase beta subunit